MSLRDLLSGLIAPLPKPAPNIGFALDSVTRQLLLLPSAIAHAACSLSEQAMTSLKLVQALSLSLCLPPLNLGIYAECSQLPIVPDVYGAYAVMVQRRQRHCVVQPSQVPFTEKSIGPTVTWSQDIFCLCLYCLRVTGVRKAM